MATKDLFSNVKVMNGLNPQTISSDTTTAGNIIDTLGFESVTLGILTGAVTDGDYTLLVQDGDESDLSDAAAVADKFLIGTEAAASFIADTDDGKSSKVGYRGIKRYVRMSVVSTNTSSGAFIAGYCILGDIKSGPDTTQTR